MIMNMDVLMIWYDWDEPLFFFCVSIPMLFALLPPIVDRQDVLYGGLRREYANIICLQTLNKKLPGMDVGIVRVRWGFVVEKL